MLSRVSSDETNGVNYLVRRAVRAALAAGAAMLLASLQVQAQAPATRKLPRRKTRTSPPSAISK